jgi:hypothetical protein
MAIPELKELICWWKPLLTDEYIVYMAMENFGLPKHDSWSWADVVDLTIEALEGQQVAWEGNLTVRIILFTFEQADAHLELLEMLDNSKDCCSLR